MTDRTARRELRLAIDDAWNAYEEDLVRVLREAHPDFEPHNMEWVEQAHLGKAAEQERDRFEKRYRDTGW